MMREPDTRFPELWQFIGDVFMPFIILGVIIAFSYWAASSL